MKQFLSFLWRMQMVRNLAGAGAGALVALVIYQVYVTGSGVMTAYLPPKGISHTQLNGQVRVSDPTIDSKRIAHNIAEYAHVDAVQNLPLRARVPVQADVTNIQPDLQRPITLHPIAVQQLLPAHGAAGGADGATVHEKLPNSGPGLWIVIFGALGVALGTKNGRSVCREALAFSRA